MADQYVIAGSENPTTNWTTEVILARDSEGKPSKVVSATKPADLSKADLDKLKRLGLKAEKVSAEKAEKLASGTATGGPGADVVGAAPPLGGDKGEKSDKSDKS